MSRKLVCPSFLDEESLDTAGWVPVGTGTGTATQLQRRISVLLTSVSSKIHYTTQGFLDAING